MDLERWRARNITSRLTEFLVQHGKNTWFSDQEALNAVLWDDWQPIERGWNYITHVADAFLPAPEDEPDDPGIVHFAGRSKPWVSGVMPMFADECIKCWDPRRGPASSPRRRPPRPGSKPAPGVWSVEGCGASVPRCAS